MKGGSNMKRIILVLTAVLIGLTIIESSAIAGPATNALITCMTDNTTGKDRKDMARWIFGVMSVHPEIVQLSNVSETNREQLDRTLADLVTRLLTENCKEQTKYAMKNEGSETPLKTAFGVVGNLAMQELMANQIVNSATSRFAKYLDLNKLTSAFSKE
jgi:hypothetical protein